MLCACGADHYDGYGLLDAAGTGHEQAFCRMDTEQVSDGARTIEERSYGDDGGGDDDCPRTECVCPASGRYTVRVAPYLLGDSHACVPAAAPRPTP